VKPRLKPHRRALLLALLLALTATLAGTSAVRFAAMGRSIEWYDANVRARERSLKLLRGEHRPTRVLAIATHHEVCFPTEAEWFWARFRESASELETRTAQEYEQCLRGFAEDADKVRAWRPPRAPQI